MAKRAERRETRTREILDAATAIVVEEGLDSLTIARLAKRVSAAVGAIYRYFPHKDALLRAIQVESIAHFRDVFEDEVGRAHELIDATPDLSDRAAAIIRVIVSYESFFAYAERHPARHRLVDALLSPTTPFMSDDEAQTVNRALEAMLLRSASVLDQAVDMGAIEFGDGIARSYLIWAAVHGLDHFRKRDRLQPPTIQTPALRRELWRALLIGWGAKAEIVAEAQDLLDSVRTSE